MTLRRIPRISMSVFQRPTGVRFEPPKSAMARFRSGPQLAAAAKKDDEIVLMGVVGWEITASKVHEQLRALGKKPVRILVNTPGGDAFEGMAIYDMLREHPGKVTVKVMGLAASAGSIIAMAADHLEMGSASFMMIHSAWGMVVGNADEMASVTDFLNKVDAVAEDIYSKRSGLSTKDVRALMKAETWFTAREAVDNKFADSVYEQDDEDDKKSKASARLSLPPVPASLLSAASGNTQQRPALHMSATLPGVTGFHTAVQSHLNKDPQMKTLMQLLQEARDARDTKLTRQQEIVKMVKDGGRASMLDAERVEFDTLDRDIQMLDDDIRMKNFELRMAGASVSVPQNPEAPHRGAPMLNLKHTDRDEDFKGQNFTRKIIAKALAHIHMASVSEIAEARWGRTNPNLVKVIKMAAVPGGGTGSGEWGSELVTMDGRYTGDFVEYLHAMTVFDRLPLREVPANITIKGSDGAATARWVGESKAIGATSMSAFNVNLTPLKVAATAVVSNELLADSSPAAEQWVRDMLVKASAQRVDATFLSTDAAVSGVSPAGLLNGLTAKTSAGASADNARTDIEILMQTFIAARNVSGLSFVTSPGLALALQMMRNALGQPEFLGVGVEGGTLEGRPLVTGDNVGSGDLILLKPSDIWKIGDSGVQVSISRDATIEQDTAPTGDTDTPTGMTTTNMTSMFDSESTAIKVVRRINFQKRRSDAVDYIGDAGYGGVAS